MKTARCCALIALIWAADVSSAEAQCSYSVTPTSFTVASTAGTRTISIISGTACSWTATTTASWITIVSGAAGSGIGSVTISVPANPTGAPRTATMTVAGQTVSVTQDSVGCTGSVSPTSFAIGSLAASRTFSVIAGTQCSWSATTTYQWITITTGATGSGIGSVTFNVTANTTGVERIGTLSVAGQTVTITQSSSGTGQPPPAPANLRIVF